MENLGLLIPVRWNLSKANSQFSILPLFSVGRILREVVAPLLIILGIFARFVGLLIVGNMLFTPFLVHQNELLTWMHMVTGR